MPRLEYFIVCRSVSVEIDTNELTLSQVVEDVYLDEGAQVLPRVFAISSWQIQPEERDTDFQVILKILPPGEQGVEVPTNLAKGRLRHRAMQGVSNIPLSVPGELKFEVWLNGHYSASHVVTVHPAGMPQLGESYSSASEGVEE